MRNPWWLRVFFALVVVQALMLGRALIWPQLISENLPWPATPLNARFVASLYGMGALTGLFSAAAPRYVAVRISLVSVGTVTGGLLLLTLPHLGQFGSDDFPARWLIFYGVDVVIAALALYLLRGKDNRPAGHHRFAPLTGAYTALLAVCGVVMLVAPDFAVQLWPWSLTPILAQVYSVFLLTFAAGGVLVTMDVRPEAGWIWTAANLGTVLLVLGVSLANLDRFKAGPSTVAWFVVFGVDAALLAVVLLRSRGTALVRTARLAS
ncbi:hypothetical protein [Amycolatopsis vastitatis]|uniref:Uncharacterized protein n=1 Tax=Amycolatopsis vastitatis TaxID=1905142 RepID=A0A229TCG6_9PSEU|nr:hypothetical protein [Amycolatopsis vastitatis]OXM68631.1 hypothetical protein CF165_11090 [Amycolatopsis vastitatis]